MDDGSSVIEGPGSLSATFFVALTRRGLRVPAFDSGRSAAIDPAGLALVLRLAAGVDDLGAAIAETAAATGSAPEPLRELAGALDERGYLDRGPAASGSVPAAPTRREPGEAWGEDDQFIAPTPLLLRPTPAGLDLLDHDGAIVMRLDERDLAVALAFANPRSFAEALGDLVAGGDWPGMAEADVALRVGQLIDAKLLVRYDHSNSVQGRAQAKTKSVTESLKGFTSQLQADLARRDLDEAAREERTGRRRTRVIPIQPQPGLPPLALGMIFAYAKSYAGGRIEETFNLVPNWMVNDRDISSYAEHPAIYLFSNYVWSVKGNLVITEKVKAANPANITIHGGPNTPRNAADVEQFFREHPEVDVAVHGEGELTSAEMLDALAGGRRADGSFDLSVLAEVGGLTYRSDDGTPVRTADRSRVTDLDELPSPYLTGIFDAYTGNGTSAIIETNRGCPYGCTFCDWGSATLSRIRKFDLDRVFGELEWCAKNKVSTVFVADANFGIFERDVEIAEHVAALKKQYGYPRVFGTNYAKNTVKHLKRIVEAMVDAEVITEGLLSLQTMDEQTLATIKRSNIKTEKYDLLASEFRAAGLPLFVDIMLGLPGSTNASFRNDLQQCIDREVTAKIFQTEVLVNSPMNDAEYRDVHQIQTAVAGDGIYDSKVSETSMSSRALVVSTASFTRQDYDEMLDLRRAFRILENFGVLRHITRYVRQETGRREIDVIDQIRTDARQRERWPMLAWGIGVLPEVMVPPGSWSLFLDEVRRYVVDVHGVADDDALSTVLAVQHALLPARGRTFPFTVDLPHDYASWHRSMIEAKEAGHLLDWPSVVPSLRDLPAATFMVEDPSDVCNSGVGFRAEQDWYGDWEMASEVSRATPNMHREYA